jgi:hypothetical protein
MDRAELLEKLRTLQVDRSKSPLFQSQQDCLNWADQVAPLLKFNTQYHDAFMEAYSVISVGVFSATTLMTHVNRMIGTLNQAIGELEQNLNDFLEDNASVPIENVDQHISSQGQSGGITAGSVNVTGDFVNQAAPSNSRPRWTTVAAIATIVATVVAVLSYFGLKPEDSKMASENSGNVYVTSHNQSGGITANRVIINNITQEVSQELRAQLVFVNKPVDGHFETRFELSAQHMIPNLYLAAHASSIQNLDARPQRSGMHMSGHSGKREGFHFTNLQNFAGQYLVVVRTAKPEHITVEYDY